MKTMVIWEQETQDLLGIFSNFSSLITKKQSWVFFLLKMGNIRFLFALLYKNKYFKCFHYFVVENAENIWDGKLANHQCF